jgi:hypothetical protein
MSFCRAEKFFGIVTKSTAFCSATWRNFLQKALYFVQPRSEKLLNYEQKHCIWFSRAENVRPKALYFIQPRSEKL